METVTENLIINSEIGRSGYRFFAKDLNNGSEYCSEWVLRYEDFLLRKTLFALSAEVALFGCPGGLIDFNTDEILDYNYLAQTSFKIPNIKLAANQFWLSQQARDDHRKNLLIHKKYTQRVKLKTFEDEELEVVCHDKLYSIDPLNRVIIVGSVEII